MRVSGHKNQEADWAALTRPLSDCSRLPGGEEAGVHGVRIKTAAPIFAEHQWKNEKLFGSITE